MHRSSQTSTGAERAFPQVEQVLEVEDDPKAFADKTVALYQDNDRCRQMCEGTQKYIREHFSMDGAWKVIEGEFFAIAMSSVKKVIKRSRGKFTFRRAV